MNKAKVLALSLIIAIMAMYMPACAQEAEAGDFTGILTVADDQKIIVSNAKDTKEFVTDDLTQYDMSGESSFCMNDIVLVKYHSKGKTLVADSMTLKKHVHEDPVFSGTVTGLDDKSVTVTSNSLTITFSIDDGTAVDGNLRMGDTVKVSYIGDLSEFPKAAEIKVTKEVPEEPQTLTASGIISEFTDSSLLLSLDSAHSRKFTIDKNTKITGVAKTLKVGDSVNVTFNNTGGDAPLATEINIVKETAPQTRTINGTVKSVGTNALTVITDEKSYTFTTDENTKYKGVKPAVGYKAEVTYTESNGKNIASVVYCRKADEKGVTANGTVLSWGNGLAAISIDGKGNTILEYTNTLEKASGYTPQVNDYVQITYMKSTDELSRIELIYRPAPPKPTPEEPTAASGVIASWGDGKCTITVNGTAMNFTYTKDLDISKGYKPQAKDEVDISYTKSDSVLRKIVLTNRPQPPSPVIIKTEGTLTAWGINGQNRCTVATAGNGTLELSYDPASLKIPTGYMPQADDNVKITYTESDMVLKEIALLSRPDHKVTAEATIKAWGIDGMNMCSVGIQGSGELILTYDPADLDIPAGYYPQTDDYVSITYTSNDKVLRAISLISRPEKPEPAPEPEPTPEPEPAPEPEPEPTPVLISAQDVTIVSGDEDSRTCTVRLSSGDSIELRFDGDTDVAAGYFPQAGDTVDITYDMDNMLLKSIRLKDRPAPADDANDRDNADDGDDASDASDESQETQ